MDLNDALKHLVNVEPKFKDLIETCVTDELQKRLKGGNQSIQHASTLSAALLYINSLPEKPRLLFLNEFIKIALA